MSLPRIVVPGDPDPEPRTGFYCPECEQDTFPPYAHKFENGWHMSASGGGFYELLQNEMGGWTCSCPSFHFRGRCRHVFGSAEHPGVYELEAREARKQKQPSKVRLEDLFS